MVGAASGASVGSVIPVVGTLIGGFLGELLGSVSGSVVTSQVTLGVLSAFIEDDAEKMQRVLKQTFEKLAFDYMFNSEEGDSAIDEFKQKNLPQLFRTMYASSNREKFACGQLEPIIIRIAKSRKVIVLPTNEHIAQKAEQVIEELVVIQDSQVGDTATDTEGEQNLAV